MLTFSSPSRLSVSVALCTYNGAQFLQEQLNSFTNQTRLPDEVIVCDDSSTDTTLEILEDWKKSAPFSVNIVRNEHNLGYVRNFEKAISLCTKDVIFLSDQDDVWLPEKLEKMMAVFEAEPDVSLVFCEADTVDANGKPLNISQGQIGFPASMQVGRFLFSPYYFSCRNVAGCCLAFRQRFLEFLHSELFEKTSHDLFLLNTLPALGDARQMQERLIQYRIHGRNVSVCSDWLTAHQEALMNARTVYRRIADIYFFKEEELNEYIHLIETFPESKHKSKILRYLKGNRIHYPNRSRIQRNLLVFFPFLCLEVLSGRYFERFQPWQSILYDIRIGFLHSFLFHRLIADFYRKWGVRHGR